jgi:hypothetical protein
MVEKAANGMRTLQAGKEADNEDCIQVTGFDALNSASTQV